MLPVATFVFGIASAALYAAAAYDVSAFWKELWSALWLVSAVLAIGLYNAKGR